MGPGTPGSVGVRRQEDLLALSQRPGARGSQSDTGEWIFFKG